MESLEQDPPFLLTCDFVVHLLISAVLFWSTLWLGCLPCYGAVTIILKLHQFQI